MRRSFHISPWARDSVRVMPDQAWSRSPTSCTSAKSRAASVSDRGLRTQARAVCSAALATAEGLPEDPEAAEQARELLARLDNPGTDVGDSDG